MTLLHRAPFSLLPRLARHAHTASRTPPPVTVGIRCEDPARVWERRAPLTPTEVAQLTADGVRVLVQPSARRVFPMADYISVRVSSSVCRRSARSRQPLTLCVVR